MPPRKKYQVSQFPAKYIDSWRNFVLLPKLSELSHPVVKGLLSQHTQHNSCAFYKIFSTQAWSKCTSYSQMKGCMEYQPQETFNVMSNSP